MKKNKKVTLPNKGQIKKFIEENELNIVKTTLSRLVNTLVRYKFKEVATGGAYFNDLTTETIKRAWNKIRDSSIPKKQKDKLGGSLIFNSQSKVLTDVQYTERLINLAECELDQLSESRKREIVMDCLKQEKMAQDFVSLSCDISTKINELTNKKKVKKKKAKVKKK